jgi:hypothetical protein
MAAAVRKPGSAGEKQRRPEHHRDATHRVAACTTQKRRAGDQRLDLARGSAVQSSSTAQRFKFMSLQHTESTQNAPLPFRSQSLSNTHSGMPASTGITTGGGSSETTCVSVSMLDSGVPLSSISTGFAASREGRDASRTWASV